MVDGPLLQLGERHLGGVLQVPVGDLLVVPLDVPAPAPLGRVAGLVPAPGDGVEDLGVLGELAELEAEQPGPLPVDEHDGEPFVGLEDRLQRPDVGRVVHDHAVADGQRRLHDVEEPVGRAGEEGQAPHPGTVEPAAHPGGDAVEVGGHRPGRLGPEPGGLLPGLPEEVVQLRLVVGGAHLAAPVDVEVAARHHVAGAMAGQFPDPVLADHRRSLPPPE